MFSTNGFWSIVAVLALGMLAYVCFIVPAFAKIKRIRRLMQQGHFVKGIIIDYLHNKDADQHDQYAPVVKFTAKDGQEYIVESDDYRLTKKSAGIPMEVCYDGENPADAIIRPGSSLVFQWGLITFIIVVNLALTAVVIYTAFSSLYKPM